MNIYFTGDRTRTHTSNILLAQTHTPHWYWWCQIDFESSCNLCFNTKQNRIIKREHNEREKIYIYKNGSILISIGITHDPKLNKQQIETKYSTRQQYAHRTRARARSSPSHSMCRQWCHTLLSHSIIKKIIHLFFVRRSKSRQHSFRYFLVVEMTVCIHTRAGAALARQ